MEILTDIQGLVRAITRDLHLLASYTEYCHETGATSVNICITLEAGDHLLQQASSHPQGDNVPFPVLREQLMDFYTERKRKTEAA